MKRKRILQSLLVGVGIGLLAFVGAANAQDVTQSYIVDKKLQKGTIVAHKKDKPDRVVPLKKENITDMLGVVVSSNDTPLSLSSGQPGREVYVATQGRFDVLVSNQNGPIAAGDHIAVSTIGGVGMKADERQELVIGVALQPFKGDKDSEGQSGFTDSTGSEKTVNLGRVKADVRVAANPFFVEANESGVPGFLSKAASIVTDEPISTLRMYISLSAFVVTLIIAGSVLYVGMRSGMQSVGRNPLAKKSISRSMIQVVLGAVIIFIIGLAAVYFLLTL